MAYDRDQQSGTCGTVAAALLVLFLVVVVVAVGSISWIRARTQSQIAQDQMAIARKQAVRAQKLADAARVEAEAARERNLGWAETDPDNSPAVDVGQITIGLDEDGNVSLDGNAIALDNLKVELGRMFDASSDHNPVIIRVSGQCPFEHVARTRTLCQEAGAGRLRLEVIEE